MATVTAKNELTEAAPEAASAATDAPTVAAARAAGRRRRFSSLTRRILAINLVAVLIVAGGVLYHNQYAQGLIDERFEQLTKQAEIIAAALGEGVVPPDPSMPQELDPLLAKQLLGRLVSPTETRARLFDVYGRMVADTRLIGVGSAAIILRVLPPPDAIGPITEFINEVYDGIDYWTRRDLPLYLEAPDQTAASYTEVTGALNGEPHTAERRTLDGDVLLTVAVPVQRFKRIVGALMLASDTVDIDQAVRDARQDVLLLSLFAFAATLLLSLYLASTIARPLRRLARAAEYVAQGRGRASQIPDLSRRSDEIGDLSLTLRRMTQALWERIDAIDRFAADVAHELKNPLSSLRSAIDTIERVDDPAIQKRLLTVLQQDVKRMTRLISDISAASRLDAELARGESSLVDLATMLEALVALRHGADTPGPRFTLQRDETIYVVGVESQLAQVFNNLLVNAASFSPPDSEVTVTLHRVGAMAEVSVADRGPGIPPGKTQAIFDRFYTERPSSEGFGGHSGLGLSIARQIVESHGGTIAAENVYGHGRDHDPTGARFIVHLPT